jgi:hypothetical protein
VGTPDKGEGTAIYKVFFGIESRPKSRGWKGEVVNWFGSEKKIGQAATVLFAMRRLTARTCRSATAGQPQATIAPPRGAGRGSCDALLKGRPTCYDWKGEEPDRISFPYTRALHRSLEVLHSSRRTIAFPEIVFLHHHLIRKPVFWVRLTLYAYHTISTALLAQKSFLQHRRKAQSSHSVAGSATSSANPITFQSRPPYAPESTSPVRVARTHIETQHNTNSKGPMSISEPESEDLCVCVQGKTICAGRSVAMSF